MSRVRAARVRPALLLALLALAGALGLGVAQDEPQVTTPPTHVAFGERPWQACEGLDGCEFVLLAGDPAAGATQWLFRIAGGAPFPDHWHSTPENLTGVQGELVFRFGTGDVRTLRRGDFLSYEAGMVHGGECASEEDCLYYVLNPLPYDIHLVGP